MSTPDRRRPWLYDPSVGSVLVRAHRPPAGRPVDAVVSDVLWTDVLVLVRWAEATLHCPPDVVAGTAWRTAAVSAALLRRLPGLCAELGLAWPGARPVDGDDAGGARDRLRAAADRLAGRLRTPGAEIGQPDLVATVAADADEIGAAAIALLAEGADWGGPRWTLHR